MNKNKRSSTAFRFWSRLITAVTGALSILAALQVVIEDSVGALLLLALDFYRKVVLALLGPLLDLFSIETVPATENFLVYASFLFLNLWRATFSTIDRLYSRYSLAAIAFSVYLSLFWLLYFWGANTPGKNFDEGQILWGSMIVAALSPLIGLLFPFALAIFFALLWYAISIPLAPVFWVGKQVLRIVGVREPAESFKRLGVTAIKPVTRMFRWIGSRIPATDSDTSATSFPGTILLRYLVGTAQGIVAALIVFILSFLAN